MMVIPFPSKKSRVAVPATPSSVCSTNPSFKLAALLHWTEVAFPDDAFEDDLGYLAFYQTDDAALIKLFRNYGLCLPNRAPAHQALELWKLLTSRYGQAVRLVDDNRAEEIENLCPDLSFAERQYCIEVALGNIAQAQRLAARLVTGARFRLFLAR